ncbi:MAG: recombination-associated protein RdgC, partial [Planctomycetota bacterium]
MRIKISGSQRRYFVDDLRLTPADAWLEAKLHEHRFRSIDRAANAIESAGWVTLGIPSATRFGLEEIWYDDFLCLGLRVDRKRLPANALRVRLLELLDAERSSQGLGSVARDRRQELRDKLESELFKRAIPSTQLYQVVWAAARGELFFSSTSESANSAFVTLFSRTFGRTPVPAFPGLAAKRAELPAAHRRRLSQVVPAWFAAEQAVG